MKLSRRKFLAVVVAAPVAAKAAPSAVVLKPRSAVMSETIARDMLLHISSFKFHGLGSDLHRQYLENAPGGSRIQSPFTYKK